MQTVMPGIKHSDFGSTVTVRGSRPPAMMMMMMMPALLSAALLLLPETLTEGKLQNIFHKNFFQMIFFVAGNQKYIFLCQISLRQERSSH